MRRGSSTVYYLLGDHPSLCSGQAWDQRRSPPAAPVAKLQSCARLFCRRIIRGVERATLTGPRRPRGAIPGKSRTRELGCTFQFYSTGLFLL